MIDDDKHYWPKFIAASIVIACGTAIANELARVLGETLRERWKKTEEPKEDRNG